MNSIGGKSLHVGHSGNQIFCARVNPAYSRWGTTQHAESFTLSFLLDFGGHQEAQGNFDGRGFRWICTRNFETIILGDPWFCDVMEKGIRLLRTTLKLQCPSTSFWTIITGQINKKKSSTAIDQLTDLTGRWQWPRHLRQWFSNFFCSWPTSEFHSLLCPHNFNYNKYVLYRHGYLYESVSIPLNINKQTDPWEQTIFRNLKF
jgi:hypothetical protein